MTTTILRHQVPDRWPTADWLASHKGSVGIIYMDFAGMEKSPSYSKEKLYNTYGMTLVDRVIKQNQK